MPTLREVLRFICVTSEAQGVTFGEKCARQIEIEIRKEWPAERVYIPPADSRKDPGRTEDIRKAAKRLPNGDVAIRYGVSRNWVNKATKR